MQPEGTANGHNMAADGDAVGITQDRRRQSRGVGGAQQGKVGLAVGTHDRRRHIGTVRAPQVNLSDGLDHVGVGQNQTATVQDDAGPDAFAHGIGHQAPPRG